MAPILQHRSRVSSSRWMYGVLLASIAVIGLVFVLISHERILSDQLDVAQNALVGLSGSSPAFSSNLRHEYGSKGKGVVHKKWQSDSTTPVASLSLKTVSASTSEESEKSSAAHNTDIGKSYDFYDTHHAIEDKGYVVVPTPMPTSIAASTFMNNLPTMDDRRTMQPTQKLKGWQLRQIKENEREYAFREIEKAHIEILDTPRKPPLKHNRQVILDDSKILPLSRTSGSPSGVQGHPRAYTAARQNLMKHPLFATLVGPLNVTGDFTSNEMVTTSVPSLVDTMIQLFNHPSCQNLPVFLTMASVGDDLYWQLIENFVYTMEKFGLAQCALVICVTDSHCMDLCKESYFPCYDYRESRTPLPSVMEQIAILKLHHVPKALASGVDVFMLDLDVGFLNSPRHMTEVFYETPTIDVFVQLDYLFIMNRSLAGWKTWFTEPLPNIGLFLCRGNNKTFEVFDHAWLKYQNMKDPNVKKNPGKDQNHVLDGMRIGRGENGLRFAYFSNTTAALMDKIVQKWRGIELGGEATAQWLEQRHAIAVHTTCYEQRTKVMGLKAVNSFWNPLYYDPLRPTLTKQILYTSDEQVRDEIRSLLWLSMVTNRAFISPNLLGPKEKYLMESHQFHGKAMWPGFRVMFLKRGLGTETKLVKNLLEVDVLEPAFYWRVQRDYDDVPEPTVLMLEADDDLTRIKAKIEQLGNAPRIVLHYSSDTVIKARKNSNRGVLSMLQSVGKWERQAFQSLSRGATIRESGTSSLSLPEDMIVSEEEETKRVVTWAQNSMSDFPAEYEKEILRYMDLPSVKHIRRESMVNEVLSGMRTCKDVFGRLRGNRTCFQICD